MSFLDLFRHKKENGTAESSPEADIKKYGNAENLCVYVSTDKGKIRPHNEDNYFADDFGISKKENHKAEFETKSDICRIFAVCDGMGGESFGDVASRITAEELGKFAPIIRTTAPENLHGVINNYASSANNRICDMILETKCSRSGSTLAMVCICGNTVYTYNIGDSRVYFFRDGVLAQITEDQTLAMKKLKANVYTEEEARASGDFHKITSYVGVDDRRIGLKAVASPPFSLDDGKILICSDGLTDMCSDSEIKSILAHSFPNPAEALKTAGIINGGADNITCMVISGQPANE